MMVSVTSVSGRLISLEPPFAGDKKLLLGLDFPESNSSEKVLSWISMVRTSMVLKPFEMVSSDALSSA